MSSIITFLGKGGSGRTTVAIAVAKKLADDGAKVLIIGQDSSPAWWLQLEAAAATGITEIAPNLSALQIQATALLEQNWEQIKELEKQYLRTPLLKNVYGQELGILPGMDQALALNVLREQDKSGKFDFIVYDGTGELNTLRALGIPEVGSWYIRRFRQVFADSEIVRNLSPFVQPITSAILNVSWSFDDLGKNEATDILEEGRKALKNPHRVVAYLVSNDDPASIATAKYFWGGAQQIGLSVAGVFLNGSANASQDFSPLKVINIPRKTGGDWQALIDALPNLRNPNDVPPPLTIDASTRSVKVYLPGFDKKAVKLTQSGPELTIEAGNQRRNIKVPPALAGQSVKGAKFQDGYLIISF
ncbi:MAG: hypothetical protein N5P05_000324 [Chroococcopsis gigantea SAG 12.99]|jgi:anion-transporting  ArsA/GET3 family ATPase|nr:hypothetical protein [Chroococcopsis gigantea SAG 12.99]